MSYIENNLGKDEKIVYKANVHWGSLVPHIILMLVIIGFITFIVQLVKNLTTELAVTTKNVVGKVGAAKTQAMESPLNKINNIKITQSFFGKIFGYGNVEIDTASGTYSFKCISKPNDFKKAVNNEIDEFEENRQKKQAEKIASSIKAAK